MSELTAPAGRRAAQRRPMAAVGGGVAVALAVGFLVHDASVKAAALEAATSGADARRSEPASTLELPTPPQARPPQYAGTWQNYVSEYDENELAADRKFKGVRVQVTGRVRTIGMAVGGEPFLTVGEPFNGVHCSFSKADEEQLAGLRKGQPVIIDCTVRTRMLGLVVMNECVLRTNAAPTVR